MTAKYYYSFILLFHSLLFYPVACAQRLFNEGSACELSIGSKGVCTLFDKCKPVVRNFQRDIEPEFCGSSREIVCCEDTISKSEEACSAYFEGAPTILGNQILGGTAAELGEFPHMAALGFVWKGSDTISWDCGGTLISERYVLTAAHCTSGISRQLIKVRLGGVNLTAQNYDWQEYGVEKNIRHPKHKGKYNDIALVRLNRNVNFSKTIWPACLYTNLTEPEEELIITGWGATDPLGDKKSNTLMKATVQLMTLKKCNQTYSSSGVILGSGVSNDMICSDNPTNFIDSCNGDSGGPLQFLYGDKNNNVYYVVGVIIVGPTICGGAAAAVYTKVSSYVPWIESIVWPPFNNVKSTFTK